MFIFFSSLIMLSAFSNALKDTAMQGFLVQKIDENQQL
jgi:hypothetical protein